MRSSSYRIISESQLRKEYVQEKESSEIIAKEYSTSPQTIVRLMKEYKIDLRSPKERQRLSIQIYGPSKLGKRTSEETKRKLSEAHKGKTLSEEIKAKISRTQKGIKHNKEWNKKVSLALKGKKKSPEHLKKMRKVFEEKRGKTLEELYGEGRAEVLRGKCARKLEKNGAWKGGVSFEPYDKEFNWTKFFQSLLSERYNYKYSELNKMVVTI